jgi:GNAT superfamily N-acetyltransferase
MNQLQRYRRRMAIVLRSRGWRGAARFLWERLVCRRWRSIVYDDPLGAQRTPSGFPPGYQFLLWFRHAQALPEILTRIQQAGGGEFLDELETQDGIWTILAPDGRVAAWGGIYFASRQAGNLRLPRRAVLLGGGFVLPEFRRRGLHRLALNEAARLLALAGHVHVCLEVHPSNTASIGGIEQAGFRRLREVSLLILFRYLALDLSRGNRT